MCQFASDYVLIDKTEKNFSWRNRNWFLYWSCIFSVFVLKGGLTQMMSNIYFQVCFKCSGEKWAKWQFIWNLKIEAIITINETCCVLSQHLLGHNRQRDHVEIGK